MIAGQGSREQAEARRLAYADPGKLRRDPRPDRDGHASIICRGQIEAGVDAVQLFDSWSGSLAPAQFERLVIAPHGVDRRPAAASAIRMCRSSAFPRAPAASSAPMRARPGSTRSASTRRSIRPGRTSELPDGMPVQGNLDPLALIAGGEPLQGAVERILDALSATGRTSSIWGTASSRTRRSPMSRS